MSETIEGVAIKYGRFIVSSPRPLRHHDILHAVRNAGMPQEPRPVQGFMTSTGRFVDRAEACRIARTAEQIKTKTGPSDVLFSEDVW